MTGTTLKSELEINERLQVGGDELVDDEHHGDAYQYHHSDGHFGEPNTVAALKVLRQPVNDHTYQDEDEHVAVVPNDVGDLAPIPMATHLVDHVFGSVPSGFVGHGGVEVGAAAEEESGESDKGEGLEDGPSVL